MVALSRNVANKHAMEMLLTGDMAPASRAAEIGLVNHVVAPEAARQATMEMARKLASKSSMTLATGKRAYRLASHGARLQCQSVLLRRAR
jgi:enoyl-CoA hydratase/carnithine racemase